MSATTIRSHPAATAPATSEAWPEEVVARYRRVGGAAVDITEHRSEIYDNQPSDPAEFYFLRTYVDLTYRAVCQGCQLAAGWKYMRVSVPHADQFFAELVSQHDGPQEWAQLHAQQCLALPRP